MSVGAIMHQIFKIEANMPPTRLPTTVLGRVLMVEARGVGYLRLGVKKKTIWYFRPLRWAVLGEKTK